MIIFGFFYTSKAGEVFRIIRIHDIIKCVTKKLFLKRNRKIKRWLTKNRVILISAVTLLFSGSISYAYVMNENEMIIDSASCKPVLDLIAKAESNDNYNAYFGNSKNTATDFTSMTIGEVLRWQERYVAEGSPSSAVGRYQIINTTLTGLVRDLKISENEKFTEDIQDSMAVSLLKRRGIESYVNGSLSDKAFAANLAKEWAGLPRMTGTDPEKSYYAEDGLNKSLVKPASVLEAIKPIEKQSTIL